MALLFRFGTSVTVGNGIVNYADTKLAKPPEKWLTMLRHIAMLEDPENGSVGCVTLSIENRNLVFQLKSVQHEWFQTQLDRAKEGKGRVKAGKGNRLDQIAGMFGCSHLPFTVEDYPKLEPTADSEGKLKWMWLDLF